MNRRLDREWRTLACVVAIGVIGNALVRDWWWVVLQASAFAIVTLLFPPPMLQRHLRGRP